MKEGWKYVKIGDSFISIKNGANIKQTKGAGGVPITRIETLSNGRFNSDRLGYANVEDASKYENYILQENDILMSHINSLEYVGRSVVYKESYGYPIIHGMNLLRLQPKETINSRFCTYYFLTESFKKDISLITHKSVNQASFNITNLKEISIPSPSFEEQQQIVDFLDAEFAKIDKLKNQAEQSLQNAKDLFQAALKEMLTPKEGWMNLRLGEICKKITDGSHNPPSGIQSSDYLMLSSKNVRNDNFTFDNPRYLSKIDFDKENQRTDVEKDDVLLTIVGAGLGDCCTYPSNKKITFQRSVSVIKPLKDKTFGRFLMYLLQSMYDVLTKNSNGAAQKGIYLKQLQSLEINIPNLEEQSLVVMRLDSLSEKVKLLQSNYTRTIQLCADLKQALLRQVFE